MEVIGDYLYAAVAVPRNGDQRVYLFPLFTPYRDAHPRRLLLRDRASAPLDMVVVGSQAAFLVLTEGG